MDFQTNSHILLNFVFGDNKSFSCLSKGSIFHNWQRSY